MQDFDGGFVLEEQKQEILFELLHSDLFCQQVVRDCQLPEGTAVAFSGVVFQPVPWSPATKKGMPRVRGCRVCWQAGLPGRQAHSLR